MKQMKESGTLNGFGQVVGADFTTDVGRKGSFTGQELYEVSFAMRSTSLKMTRGVGHMMSEQNMTAHMMQAIVASSTHSTRAEQVALCSKTTKGH